MRRALAAALVVRLASALLIRTAFAPDEFWQSVEVAHRLAFGYGHLTWEWAAGLRSYVHPLLFAAPYAALRVLRLDSAWAVARVPLLLQALAAAATDVYVARLAALVFGAQVGGWCLLCQLASWFNAYCLPRTYSNCLEALAAAAGAYHWLRSDCGGSGSQVVSTGESHSRPSSSKRGRRADGPAAEAEATRRCHQRAWIAFAAASVVVRPPSALFWVLPAGLQLVWQQGRGRWLLLLDAAAIGGGLLGAAALVDRALYGRWVAVPWEFLRFNLLAGASAQYGGHPWHWNLSQGLPAVAASLLPLLAAGLLLARRGAARWPALLAAWSVATYSLPAHKEFRFLLPALQLLMPYCGLATACLFGCGSSGGGSSSGGSGSRRRQRKGSGAAAASNGLPRPAGRLWRWGGVACIALQLPMAAYFLLEHQRAQVGVLAELRRAAGGPAGPAGASTLFLTPCHATPFYSHLHAPLPMRFLDCSPRQHAAATAALNAEEQAWLQLPAACPDDPALSQRRCFERGPAAYFEAVLRANAPERWPRLLVGYAPLMEGPLAGPLAAAGYHLRRRLRNCWLQTDDDSPCELHLWELP